jgi:hypothetical protein
MGTAARYRRSEYLNADDVVFCLLGPKWARCGRNRSSYSARSMVRTRRGISFRGILLAVSRPLASGILAGALAFEVRLICGQFVPRLPRLVLESSVLLITFFGALLFVAGQKSLYLDLLRRLRGPSSAAEKLSVPA